MPKGLLVHTYRRPFRDYSNGGASSRQDVFVLVGKGIPELFSATPSCQPLYLQAYITETEHHYEEYLFVVPELNSDKHYMFGGNFIYTSDSRFPSRYPIPIHDRIEV